LLWYGLLYELMCEEDIQGLVDREQVLLPGSMKVVHVFKTVSKSNKSISLFAEKVRTVIIDSKMGQLHGIRWNTQGSIVTFLTRLGLRPSRSSARCLPLWAAHCLAWGKDGGEERDGTVVGKTVGQWVICACPILHKIEVSVRCSFCAESRPDPAQKQRYSVETLKKR
jgi:hypothetical protein